MSAAFHNAMDREMNRGKNENQMFLYAFEVSIESLPDNYEKVDSEMKNIVTSIKKSIGQNSNSIKITDEKENVIYEENSNKNYILTKDVGKNQCAYEIVLTNNMHYMEIMSVIETKAGKFYINLTRDIQYIYEERNEMYAQYQRALLISLIVSAILSYMISRKLSMPIVKLATAAKRMSDGEYGYQATIRADGEIGMLVKNFNIMSEKMNQNIEELEDAARKQEDFTAAFAHELKTPLTSIVGYSDMIRSMELEKKEIQEYSNYIFTQGKRLEQLSFTLMDLITLDRQEITFHKINVKKLCVSIKGMVEPALKSKKIHFKMEVENGFVYGDRVLLISLFNNIIDNARKAVPDHGSIIVKGNVLKDGYMILVQDNGCGMEESELNKITEAFYMVDKSRARKEGGAGIGMTLCKKIVEIHGAKWTIQSKIGEGTSVYVLFPNEIHVG